MPELPEVQTVIDNLLPKINKLKICNYHEYWHKVNYSNNSKILKKELLNMEIFDISRIGKYIIIKCNSKFIVFHLRMTGFLYHKESLPKNKKHIRCYFKFSNNSFLIYEDIRKFGGFFYTKNLIFLKNKVGIDALDSNLTDKYLFKILKTKKKKLKYFLLDQKYICGLGNIYIDEVLWKSKLHPEHQTHKITLKKSLFLVTAIKTILIQSIKFHGTTIINFKFDNMKTGNYKTQLNVYGRENKKCNSCNSRITKKYLCGRATYFCPSCQEL